MKIIVNNRVIDTDKEAVCLVLNDEEKQHIANMGDQTRYAIFPDSWNRIDPDYKLKFMKGHLLPDSDIRIYFDRQRKSACVRSDTDGICMHYPDGTKLGISVLQMIENYVLLFSEPKTNWIRLSNFVLRQQIRSGCRTYNPGVGKYNFSVMCIDYHWDTNPETDEEWRDHNALVDWINIHQAVHADIYFEIRELMQ